jgi:hypothetical protein
MARHRAHPTMNTDEQRLRHGLNVHGLCHPGRSTGFWWLLFLTGNGLNAS